MLARSILKSADAHLLELAKQRGTVSPACRVTGYSRGSSFRFQDVERTVDELAVEQPMWGQTRAS